jgi:hypothetical protein
MGNNMSKTDEKMFLALWFAVEKGFAKGYCESYINDVRGIFDTARNDRIGVNLASLKSRFFEGNFENEEQRDSLYSFAVRNTSAFATCKGRDEGKLHQSIKFAISLIMNEQWTVEVISDIVCLPIAEVQELHNLITAQEGI